MLNKRLCSILLSVVISTTLLLSIANTKYCSAKEINLSKVSKIKYHEVTTKINEDDLEDDLYNKLKTLSSTSRVAGLPEEDKTVDFISSNFKNYGYDVKIQSFDFTSYYTKKYATKNELTVENMENEKWKIEPITNSSNGKIKGNLFYYDDSKIDIKDLKNKIVIIYENSYEISKKINHAIDGGALGIIFYGGDENYKYGLPSPNKIVSLSISKKQGEDIISKLKENKKLSASINVEGSVWSKKSHNVIAIKKPVEVGKKKDILIISAHHDTVQGTNGANDNASGTAVLMEVAKVLSKVPTDTEIRFISFGAEELGLLGSKHYVESLPEDERKRIIGDIQVDMVGNKKSNTVVLGTVDGKETLLSKIINKANKELNNNKFKIIEESRSDHASFVKNKIPALLVTQDCDGNEYHSIWDKWNIISKEKLMSITKVIAKTAEDIMDIQTPSLIEKSREINDYNKYVYTQPTKSVIYFGFDRNFTENKIGSSGKLIFKGKNEFNDSIEKYLYNMNWFEYDKPIPTEYNYRNDFLEEITIDMEKSGISKEDALKIMKKALGKPALEEKKENYKVYGWSTIYHKYFSFLDYGDSYKVIVDDYYPGDIVYGDYTLKNGKINISDKDVRNKKVWEFTKKIIAPKDLKRIKNFIIFSDGVSYKLGYSAPLNNEKNNHDFQYAVDINDIFNEDGNYRDFNKMIETLIHEYGHVLTLNDSQVDLSKNGDIKIFFEKGKYYDKSYMKLFYDKFWKDINNNLDSDSFYKNHRSWFVSEYASTDVSEDIAETFAQFVLNDKPSNETVAYRKVNFFYEFKEMVNIRNYIRKNLGLDNTNNTNK